MRHIFISACTVARLSCHYNQLADVEDHALLQKVSPEVPPKYPPNSLPKYPRSLPRINVRLRKHQSIYYFEIYDNEKLFIVLNYLVHEY